MNSRKIRIGVEFLNALFCFVIGFYTNEIWLYWFAWGSVGLLIFEIIFFIVEVWFYAEMLNRND
jgi:hypothetical protein